MRANLPKRVLLLGSGALQIGQAGEFDYSGSQALKALREEGIFTVLINPNIATIQTDHGMADETYFLPVQPEFVEKVLRKEKCDAILLSFGGQTALNCGLALEESGVLRELGVSVLGTPVSTIRDTEDRHLFAERLREIDVHTARGRAVKSTEEVLLAARELSYPVMMRSGFSLGGKGSSIVYNEEQCRRVAETAFSSVPQILVEECLSGWKELEYEVVRDAADNCITVCNMENVDPMGIHTGESIVVAPSQTLDDYEYQMLRDVAIKTIRHLGIVGECNIQYALNPKNREYRVIEVNARLSRSSALASKATGYPLAYVAAKIALGYELPEIPNSITKMTTAFFEPALDYVVCKVPRWDLQKFKGADLRIGSEMKSVGEVMAIGRNFAEALQKALRMLEVGVNGLDPNKYVFEDLRKELAEPTPRRMFAVAKAFDIGMSCEDVAKITHMDPFFLAEIQRCVMMAKRLQSEELSPEFLLQLKQAGFSDRGIADLTHSDETQVRSRRQSFGIRPKLTQIDTLAAEYPAETNFLYFSYTRSEHDIKQPSAKSVLVLGSGCYRIGSSVEFDWCGVSTVRAARELGYEATLINCNPETVSTDYDNCERLVFDEISLETVLELYDFEKPEGVFVSMGGQTPNNLALKLHEAGVKLFGTSAKSIDMAEDRCQFSALLDKLQIAQPKWKQAEDLAKIDQIVDELSGYPVLVRPSYVLSGSAMAVAHDKEELISVLKQAADISSEHPVAISKFEEFAREIEFDAVANQGEVVLWTICEHIENAGVHSGDATLVIPPQRLPFDSMRQMKDVGFALAKNLQVTGPFNVQMLVKNNEVKVIELNLRASRSFPFISKATGVNFINEAARIMLGRASKNLVQPDLFKMNYVAVKAPQFSFSRIRGADPRLGVEMASTGEVACFGANTEEALMKAMLAVGFKMPKLGVLVDIEEKGEMFSFEPEFKLLKAMGLNIYPRQHDIKELFKLMKSGKIGWVISVPPISRLKTSVSGYEARRMAADLGVSLTTDLWVARRLVAALSTYPFHELQIEPWSHYVKMSHVS